MGTDFWPYFPSPMFVFNSKGSVKLVLMRRFRCSNYFCRMPKTAQRRPKTIFFCFALLLKQKIAFSWLVMGQFFCHLLSCTRRILLNLRVPLLSTWRSWNVDPGGFPFSRCLDLAGFGSFSKCLPLAGQGGKILPSPRF